MSCFQMSDMTRCGVLFIRLWFEELWLLEGTSSMVGNNDAGPFVNNWDEEESRAKDRHQEEGPQKHSI